MTTTSLLYYIFKCFAYILKFSADPTILRIIFTQDQEGYCSFSPIQIFLLLLSLDSQEEICLITGLRQTLIQLLFKISIFSTLWSLTFQGYPSDSRTQDQSTDCQSCLARKKHYTLTSKQN